MTNEATEIGLEMMALGRAARAASSELATSSREQRDLALHSAAEALRSSEQKILKANALDLTAAQKAGMSSAMLDRLMLDHERIDAMAIGLDSIAALPDPVGRVLAEWDRPNGLNIQRVAVPLGVIGIIYESRPNVTADAAALCLKSGNAVILRGGSDSFESSHAIFDCMRAGLEKAGINGDAIQMVPTRDRAAVGFLLSSMASLVDVVVPRGGKSLIKRVQDEARVPVIGHLEGICHVYLHASADATVAREVVLNAKMRRTGICGAAETILVDADVAEALLPDVCGALLDAGCEIRGDEGVVAIVPGATRATEEDWVTEYLDSIEFWRVKNRYPKTVIQTNLQDDLMNIKGSAVHLSKVIMNILHNGLEAMPAGGEIIISTSNTYVDSSLHCYEHIPEGEYSCVSISDEGVGIPKAELGRVFEPFYTKKSMGNSGTGLGMTVIWATVKDHNGYLDIKSREGHGTTLKIYLPATREIANILQRRVVLDDYIGSESILIVDDVAEQLEIAKNMLSKLGYSVIVAISGWEAVQILKKQTVDLVVLDMIMPTGLDGLETYQEIVKICPEQKAIITSGYSESKRVIKLQQLGAGNYVQKPYSMEVLGIAVREELDR